MAVGDGTVVREGLAAILDILHRVAAPTGTRGSILLMTGGLVVLGFLFLAFLFRSAIVGDLAPVSNARAPLPRVRLPPRDARVAAQPTRSFDAARAHGGSLRTRTLEAAFEEMRLAGLDARILRSGARSKRIRSYACTSCSRAEAAPGCEQERGLLAGTFEALTGELAKVEEIACRGSGAPYCEFDVSHSPLPEARA